MPYGTGNDLARVTNWGGTPSGRIYSSLRNLVSEICENTREEKLNIWSIKTSFKERGGNVYEVNSRTKQLEAKNEQYFERDMTNYFGIGEDGRIGLGFELHRTTNRYCNKAVYFLVGCCNFFCPWTRGLTISDQIEYVKTYASTATSTTNDGSSNE